MKRSAETGLPEVPEGYHWEIRNSESIDSVKLVLVQNIPASRTIRDILDGRPGFKVDVSSALTRSTHAWDIRDCGEKILARQKLLGSYPPKRLSIGMGQS